MIDIDDAIAAIDKIRQPADVVSQEEGVIRRGWVTNLSFRDLLSPLTVLHWITANLFFHIQTQSNRID